MIIESKVLGHRARPFEPWRIDREAIGSVDTLSLRDLLERIVRWEVAAFEQRRRERMLERVLSPGEIGAGAIRGKIDMGGREVGPAADADRAVDSALLAFRDGFYYVFLDERQLEDLDETVTVHQDSRLLFVRLVPLAGR